MNARARMLSIAAGMALVVSLTLMVPGESPSQTLGGDAMAGKVIYEQHCQRCHGTGGWGDGPKAGELRVPPANFHGPILQMKTDEQLLTSVEFGLVMSPMHAFRGTLSDRELQDVVAYVRLLGQRGR